MHKQTNDGQKPLTLSTY